MFRRIIDSNTTFSLAWKERDRGRERATGPSWTFIHPSASKKWDMKVERRKKAHHHTTAKPPPPRINNNNKKGIITSHFTNLFLLWHGLHHFWHSHSFIFYDRAVIIVITSLSVNSPSIPYHNLSQCNTQSIMIMTMLGWKWNILYSFKKPMWSLL